MYDIEKADGWVKVYRKIKETSFYKSSVMVHIALHCILSANRKPMDILINGNMVTIAVGSFITSRKKMAQETGVSEQKIRTGINNLKKAGFLTHESTKHYTLITVTNYDVYNEPKNEVNQAINQHLTNDQPTLNHKQEYKSIRIKEKTSKKKKGVCVYSENFEKVWERYPSTHRTGKKQAFRHYKATVHNQQDYNAINRALDIYLSSDRVKRGIVQNGSTWFNQWQDWLEIGEVQTQVPTSKPSTPAQQDRKVQTQKFEQFIKQAVSLQDIATYILENPEWEHDYYDMIDKKKGRMALAQIKRLILQERQKLTAQLRHVTSGIGTAV